MEEKRYYAEYTHANTLTHWRKETNHIEELEPMTKNLTNSQSYYIWDNKLQKILFDKVCGQNEPRTNELSKLSRDLRTKDGTWK